MLRRSLALALLGGASVFLPRAWGQGTPDAEIAPGGRLRVGMLAANPVLVRKGANGALSGISVDMAQSIARALAATSAPVVYDEIPPFIGSYGGNDWDIAIGPRGPAMEDKVFFTQDILLVDNIYAARPGRRFASAAEVDKPGVRVGVGQGGAPDQTLSRSLQNATIVRLNGAQMDKVAAALSGGEVDVYGSNGENIYQLMQRVPGATVVPGAFATIRMAVAMNNGRSPAAQARLNALVGDAKAAGLVRAAIARDALKGVREAP